MVIALCCGGAFADTNASQLSTAVLSYGSIASVSRQTSENTLENRTLGLGMLTAKLPDHSAESWSHSEAKVTKRSDENELAAVPQPGSIVPTLVPRDEDALATSEPFNLPAQAIQAGDVPARWTELRSRVLADERILANCSTADNSCPPAAQRLLSIVEIGRKRDGRAQLGWVNRAVNLSIRPMSDWVQYGYAQFWASPLQTLSSGAGDCKDYAIVKYAALRKLGISADDLRLVIVRDSVRQAEHEIVAVRHGKNWLILDNLTMSILDAEQVGHYSPLFVMDHRGVRAFTSVVAHR